MFLLLSNIHTERKSIKPRGDGRMCQVTMDLFSVIFVKTRASSSAIAAYYLLFLLRRDFNSQRDGHSERD
jgi:hypothetical protein